VALTEDLNLVVISFREETDKHNHDGRDLDVGTEANAVRTGDEKKARYRENSTLHTPTNSYRRRYWVHCSGVVKRIEEMYPDMPIYEVYNVVTSVCEDPDIITHTWRT
jgi:hypothetical protein